ncbi:hypothetical protein L211DRAFT_826561 [Terfezia boudieri ATCC MYA-4762]|uniref:NWD NACHT-NTPase N-terminal domain-containing protein n=1 Tax=Terfezia boudieri ATCC MYA-4762 TaxID=1051890 RepID=A0A3N4LMU7_9PEZI|nr:hypothetical protein L211DRAFT_826561 [Terfezia boudieri ATCC MYA-4762]
MGDRKKKGFRFFRNSGSGDLSDPLAGSARVQSDSDLRPEQPLGEQKPQQAALSPPTMTRVRRIFRLGRRSPSPGHGVERERNTPTANSYQNSADPASECARPYSSYSDSSALQINAGGDVTVGPSGGHGSPSSACAQGSSAMSVSAPIIQISHSDSESMASKNPIPPSICSPHTPTSICHVQASAETDVQAPHTNSALDPDAMEASSQVWAKALEIAKKKLSDKNLPPLDLTNLTSQSAEENIEAVIKALNTAQEDDKKNRWSYTWRGKEVIVVERLGKILKNVEKYSQVVNIAIQANPQVSALVWAGVWAIMRVALNHVEAIEGFEVAIAALLEKMSICEFYAGIYIGAPLSSLSAANSLQRQCMLDSALPELYASVIVFAVKARVYFEARGT